MEIRSGGRPARMASALAMLLMIGNAQAAPTRPSPAEEAALDAIFSSFYPNKIHSGPDRCEWDGVNCTTAGAVCRISLREGQMPAGSRLDPAIGNLTHLKILDVSGNPELGGTLPTEVGRLTRLTLLNVSWTKLSGTLPTEIGRASSLRLINVVRSQLGGQLPSELGLTKRLTKIEAFECRFSGTVPSELGSITGLATLWLSANSGLSGTLPTELGYLTELKRFSVSETGLTGNIPTEFGKFTKLKRLSLRVCALGGTLPTELGNLAELTFLGLRENRFSGSLPTEIGKLTSLKTLEASSCVISGLLPAELVNLKRLTYLDLSNNRLSGTVPRLHAAKLKTCKLDRNWLTDPDGIAPSCSLTPRTTSPPSLHLPSPPPPPQAGRAVGAPVLPGWHPYVGHAIAFSGGLIAAIALCCGKELRRKTKGERRERETNCSASNLLWESRSSFQQTIPTPAENETSDKAYEYIHGLRKPLIAWSSCTPLQKALTGALFHMAGAGDAWLVHLNLQSNSFSGFVDTFCINDEGRQRYQCEEKWKGHKKRMQSLEPSLWLRIKMVWKLKRLVRVRHLIVLRIKDLPREEWNQLTTILAAAKAIFSSNHYKLVVLVDLGPGQGNQGNDAPARIDGFNVIRNDGTLMGDPKQTKLQFESANNKTIYDVLDLSAYQHGADSEHDQGEQPGTQLQPRPTPSTRPPRPHDVTS